MTEIEKAFEIVSIAAQLRGTYDEAQRNLKAKDQEIERLEGLLSACGATAVTIGLDKENKAKDSRILKLETFLQSLVESGKGETASEANDKIWRRVGEWAKRALEDKP